MKSITILFLCMATSAQQLTDEEIKTAIALGLAKKDAVVGLDAREYRLVLAGPSQRITSAALKGCNRHDAVHGQ